MTRVPCLCHRYLVEEDNAQHAVNGVPACNVGCYNHHTQVQAEYEPEGVSGAAYAPIRMPWLLGVV